MFKLIGQALGHSFGLAVIVLLATFGVAQHWLYMLYVGGYALIPVFHTLNIILLGRQKRKSLKTIIHSEEFKTEYKFNLTEKASKKISKDEVKTEKKLNKIKIKDAKGGK